MLDGITTALAGTADRKDEDWQTLKKSMGYCWSVAAAANPQAGRPLMEHWLNHPDPAIHRVMIENLKKNRLLRAAPEWTARWLTT
ncbi:MAG: hypothetical protein HGA86_07370, partial [Anaerolineaceae bacterium]|nr:hypothetical protein [Anaerolineaceae bacterium]